mgnify:CR=1 FL=1
MLRLPALIALIAVVAGPAAAQTSIRPGQTLRGELSTSDPMLDDGSHYDCFTVQTRQGQRLQIDQTSDAFDSYMAIGSGTCTRLTNSANDDDGGDGLNARLVRMGDGGVLNIRVNSLEGGKTGPYQLGIMEVSDGASSPAQGVTTIRVGQVARGELTDSDPTLDDGSSYDCFQVQTRRGQTLQIDQSSTDFDSYLSIGSGSRPSHRAGHVRCRPGHAGAGLLPTHGRDPRGLPPESRGLPATGHRHGTAGQPGNRAAAASRRPGRDLAGSKRLSAAQRHRGGRHPVQQHHSATADRVRAPLYPLDGEDGHPFNRQVAPPGLSITTTFRALSLSPNGLPSD